MRATEQKHLQVSVSFIGATALALSFLVATDVSTADWRPLIQSWPRVIAYFVLVLAGCMTMFAQHVYRGWKKDYLLASKKLVYDWPIPDDHRVNWMRTDRGPYAHADRLFFRLAGDNVLFYFVLIITSCIVLILAVSLWELMSPQWLAGLLVALVSAAYGSVVIYITAGGQARKDRLENDWDDFRRLRKSSN